MNIMNERLEDLESRLAFQENSIQELSDIIAGQQKQIEQLQLMVSALRDQVRNLTPSLIASEAEETPPPHY